MVTNFLWNSSREASCMVLIHIYTFRNHDISVMEITFQLRWSQNERPSTAFAMTKELVQCEYLCSPYCKALDHCWIWCALHELYSVALYMVQIIHSITRYWTHCLQITNICDVIYQKLTLQLLWTSLIFVILGLFLFLYQGDLKVQWIRCFIIHVILITIIIIYHLLSSIVSIIHTKEQFLQEWVNIK